MVGTRGRRADVGVVDCNGDRNGDGQCEKGREEKRKRRDRRTPYLRGEIL